ncbi:MAG: TerB family tellurite resistance protein [Gammaproteobacteria bacterium]|nr:TerB family tellurite resistance protein [Gammaproteobacteria bacterium]
MITRIKNLLVRYTGPVEAGAGGDERALQLATATLLMEVARADMHISDEERQAILAAMGKHYGLSYEATQQITRAAEHEAEHSTSLYPFTRLINRECDYQDKLEIIRMLWQVIRADDCIDKHEEHLVRRVAELLHVPHREFIRAKLLALET